MTAGLALAGGCAPGQDRAGGGAVSTAKISHIHAIAVDPRDDTLRIATHEGLFQLTTDGAESYGRSTRDLMGFTVTGPGRYLSSGHPGPGDDGPAHAGLIASTNGGFTWEPLALSGEADFHAMAAGERRVWAFDSLSGRLMTGRLPARAGMELESMAPTLGPVAALAAVPGSESVVATTAEGVMRVDSSGAVEPAEGWPPLVVVTWPEQDLIVGVDVDRRVQVSRDGGRTWSSRSLLAEPATSIVVGDSAWFVSSDDGVQRSTDDGRTWKAVSLRLQPEHPD